MAIIQQLQLGCTFLKAHTSHHFYLTACRKYKGNCSGFKLPFSHKDMVSLVHCQSHAPESFYCMYFLSSIPRTPVESYSKEIIPSAESSRRWAINMSQKCICFPLTTQRCLFYPPHFPSGQLLTLQMISCHVNYWFLSSLERVITRTILLYLRGVAGPCVKDMFTSLGDQ